jgi:hypothetical protein
VDVVVGLVNKRTKEILVATLALTAAAVSLYFAFGRSSTSINLGPYEVLGATTAEETAKLVGQKGHVLVIVRDTGANKNPSVEAELEAFQQTLTKHPGLTAIIERVAVTPMLMMSTGGAVPPDQLLKALESHPNLGAVVLFFAFPQLADAQLDAVKKFGAKTVVVSSPCPGYRRALERQAIQLVIAPRPDAPPADAPAPRTIRERFDQEFLILTPAEAAALP